MQSRAICQPQHRIYLGIADNVSTTNNVTQQSRHHIAKSITRCNKIITLDVRPAPDLFHLQMQLVLLLCGDIE